jgi:diguanylate cyclase (GGDEF)-like protein
VAQLNYFAMAVYQLTHRDFPTFATSLNFFDFVLQGVMGFGMITCLLEDERQAATLASNEIEHLAYHDSLTGLPNRPLFIDRLFISINMAERSRSRLAVFFCDLDRFKEINDSLGHSVGDELLRVVSERIRSSVRSEDTVARFGGDEFTLIVQKIDRVDDAVKVAQKIIDTVKIPFRVGEHELFVTTSIGISLYPNDGRDAETLVKNADTAMYRAKDMGRDSFQLYAPAMNARALEKLALENMLRKALAQQELVVFYQPIIDLKEDTVTGFEALVRWAHPELGLLSPAHFIPTAEVSGLIIPIGDWVLRTAARQTRLWQKKFGKPLSISVNLSARQFQQPDLVAGVKGALHHSGLDARSLHLEISESNAMQNAENTAHTLRELKSVGVCISMDDFGTGYSSLSYLKRFPIDTLKLDRSFVSDLSTDPEDEAIATAVLAMAHSLDLRVVAEGVETSAQLAFLQERDCDMVQGYYFSPPLGCEELEELLEKKGLRGVSRDAAAS